MSIEQGHPGKVNYDGEPVSRDTTEAPAIEADLTETDLDTRSGDLLPQPRTSEDYIIPETDTSKEHAEKPRRRGLAVAAGAVALALTTGTAGIFIATSGNDEPKDTGSRFDTTTSAAPFETTHSQAPITSETTSVVIETKTSTPEVADVPLSLDGYVFLGDKAIPEAESKSKVAIHGEKPAELSASLRTLAGQLMSGGTNPNVMMHTAGNNPAALKAHLADQINNGLLSGVLEGKVSVNAENPLLTTSVDLPGIIVGGHNRNIDANQQGQNIYSGGNISEVDVKGEEEVAIDGGYTIVKSVWAVNNYDRSGPNATKGALTDTQSYKVSVYFRPGPEGTATVAKFQGVKVPNS